MSVRAINLMLS